MQQKSPRGCDESGAVTQAVGSPWQREFGTRPAHRQGEAGVFVRCVERRCAMGKRVLAILALALAAGAVFVICGTLIDHLGWELESIANIAQIIEGFVALILLGSALVLAEEIRESIRSRHLDGMRYVRRMIGTDAASENRKWVYQELKKANWPLSSEDDRRALAICRDFDHVGFLCRHGLIPVKLVVETYNRNILDMWNRLERFIVQWRQERDDEDYFWEFEWLARRAREAQRQIEGRHRKFPRKIQRRD